MALTGTTGTGLDSVIGWIAQDYGLQMSISGASIRQGAAAADGMNFLIVEAVTRLGLANDGQITTSDVYSINSYLRANHLAQFTALHGNDGGGIETGFHAVQGDGSVSRMYGESAVDTVLDDIYHIAFRIVDGHFVNEDGNWGGDVGDVANWLNTLLAPELAAGTLANGRADPLVHGTTGTGLDQLIDIIVSDPGLNRNLSHKQINDGADFAKLAAEKSSDTASATPEDTPPAAGRAAPAAEREHKLVVIDPGPAMNGIASGNTVMSCSRTAAARSSADAEPVRRLKAFQADT